jgi:hypothetical protein
MAARLKLTPEERIAKRLSYKREYYRKWRVANKDKVNQSAADWRQRNLDKARKTNRDWKKKNAAAHCALNAKRKSKLLQRTPAWADLDKIKEFYAAANSMSKNSGIEYHVDHVIPLQGKLCSGLHVENNLQILTAKENMSKGNKTMYQFCPHILEGIDEIGKWLE